MNSCAIDSRRVRTDRVITAFFNNSNKSLTDPVQQRAKSLRVIGTTPRRSTLDNRQLPTIACRWTCDGRRSRLQTDRDETRDIAHGELTKNLELAGQIWSPVKRLVCSNVRRATSQLTTIAIVIQKLLSRLDLLLHVQSCVNDIDVFMNNVLQPSRRQRVVLHQRQTNRFYGNSWCELVDWLLIEMIVKETDDRCIWVLFFVPGFRLDSGVAKVHGPKGQLLQ